MNVVLNLVQGMCHLDGSLYLDSLRFIALDVRLYSVRMEPMDTRFVSNIIPQGSQGFVTPVSLACFWRKARRPQLACAIMNQSAGTVEFSI